MLLLIFVCFFGMEMPSTEMGKTVGGTGFILGKSLRQIFNEAVLDHPILNCTSTARHSPSLPLLYFLQHR